MKDKKIILKNGFLLTMNSSLDFFQGDILVENDKIVQIESYIDSNDAEIFDAREYLIMPGLIQTHIHLCQVLFRNLAEDLELLDWLQKKIWPFEAAHSEESMAISAQLGLYELLRGGTTTIMDMGTVRHQDKIFEQLLASGIRAYAGKCMIDHPDAFPGLKEETRKSIDESIRLYKDWHNADQGRIKYAFAPRFSISCTDDLLIETAQIAKEFNTIYHTHAAESRYEIELVEKRFGLRNIEVFEKMAAADANLCLAHCVWLDENEKDILRDRKIKVLHCPSANLKLASGIAPIPKYVDDGITVSLGADGAPCNNNLDIFTEMRLAGLIQKPVHGVKALEPLEIVKMATVKGAETLGLENEIGSLEIGKKADLTLVKFNQVHSIPFDNVYSKIVYSTRSTDVDHVMINGEWIVRDQTVLTIDDEKLIFDANKAVKKILNNI